MFDDYTAPPHRDEFAAALQAGAVLLWVRCADPDLEARAVAHPGGSRAAGTSTSTAGRTAAKRRLIGSRAASVQ